MPKVPYKTKFIFFMQMSQHFLRLVLPKLDFYKDKWKLGNRALHYSCFTLFPGAS